MQRQRIFRALLGFTGFAACVAALSFHAPAVGQTTAASSTITVTGIRGNGAPDIFGTVAIPANVSRYAAGWYRSRMDASSHPAMRRLIEPARGLPMEARIAFVQQAVHRQIRWISDATEWGAHDYWASAAQTLERGAGDMEDRAILKLQALKALGFRSRDLFLTMGRDKVGGPIIVGIVRLNGRHYVLDDTGGAPFVTDQRPEFEPMLTFGANMSWLHGRRAAPNGTPSTNVASAR